MHTSPRSAVPPPASGVPHGASGPHVAHRSARRVPRRRSCRRAVRRAHDGLRLSIVVTRRRQVRLRKAVVRSRTVTTTGARRASDAAHKRTRGRRIVARSRHLPGLDFAGLPAIEPWRPDRPRRHHGPTAPHRIERSARPPMRSADGRGRPPLNVCGRLPTARRRAPPPCRYPPGHGHLSLRALLRDARQKSADLGLPVPAVAAERPDRRELPSLRPPGDCLGVNPEHRRDLCRREQRLGLWCTC